MNKIFSFVNSLKGYKTHIIQACLVIYAITGFITGHIDGNSALEMIYGAGTISALRSSLNELKQ